MSDGYVDQDYKKALALQAEDQISKANSLAFMVNTEGWEIILSTIEDMKQSQLEHLSEQIPGDEKAILAAHSVWYTTLHTFDNLVNAVTTAINNGQTARQILAELNEQKREDDWL